MLSDRTYLLFKPRSNLPNDRLNIRHDNSSASYGLSSTSPSSYRANQLSHSSSYERLASKAFSGGSTPLAKRKFGATGGLSTNTSINHSIYDSNYDNLYGGSSYVTSAPRRRTATFSHNKGGSPSYNSAGNYNSPNSYTNANYDRRPALQKSDSFGSSMALYPEKSSNMEKREMLMSSFNRHTNAPSTGRGQNWFNRLKLNLFSSSSAQPKSILPPRPSSAFYNYGKSNYSSPYRMSAYRVNYLSYDDYYRPRIRDRPLFSDIRKSVMHKGGHGAFKGNNRAYYANGGYPNGGYSNKFNKNAAGAKSNASILSNGSSGGLSSSSSGGSINYTQSTSPSETPAYSSPAQSQKLESQKSIRKVDRYRSVIKFREHNIGKTYEERKQQINWDIDSEDVLSELVGGGLVNKCEPALDAGNLVDQWNVITDTTILTHTSSNTTLSDLNVGYEPVTGDEVSSKLEQQFAEIKRKNEELEKLKSALEDDSLLSSGRRKLHKSVNIRQANGALCAESGKKSKSVKINANVMVKDIRAGDLVEQVNEVNEKFSRFEAKVDGKLTKKEAKVDDESRKREALDETQQVEKLSKADQNQENEENKKQGKTKKILKTAKALSKKPSKVMIREESKESGPESPTNKAPANKMQVLNKQDEKFKNKQQAFKTLFVKPETQTVTCHLACRKTEYARLPIQWSSAVSPPIKTPFCRLELQCTSKTSPLVKTEFERPKILVVKAVASLVKTAYSSPQLVIVKLSLPPTKTAYSSPQLMLVKLSSPPIKTAYSSPQLVLVKLSSPPVRTAYVRPVVYFVETKSDPVRTDYQKPVVHRTSTRLSNFKCSYRRPELAISQAKSPALKTDFHRLKLEHSQLLLPLVKTKYERFELQVTKPVRSGLIKTEFESPKLLAVQLKSKLIRTDFTRFPVQTTVKAQNPHKTEYFRVPVQTVELTLNAAKGDYFKVPVQTVRLRVDCFASPEYHSPKAEKTADQAAPPASPQANRAVSKQPSFSQTSLNQTSAKPPLNPSLKSQLNRSSKKSTLNQLDEPADSRAPSKPESAIKSALSLNHDANEKQANQTESKESEKKAKKKVKKVKVAHKASSISGANNENRLSEIVHQTVDFDDDRMPDDRDQMSEYFGQAGGQLADGNCRLQVNEDKRKLLTRSVSVDYEQNGSNVNTFQNATASREQYRLPQRKRIKFRNYNLEDFHLQSVLGRGKFSVKTFY